MNELTPAPPDRGLIARRSVASVAAATAGLSFFAFFSDHGDLPLALGVPIGLLLVSAGLLFRAHLPSQILARAALWSNLILGTLIATTGSRSEQGVGTMLAVATAAGLLLLGRSGLDQETESFAPIAFRGSLVLAMVMALADTQQLALFGSLRLEHELRAVGTLACAGLMVVALVGLYRMKVWGVILNIVANALIAGLAITETIALPKPVVAALCTTAAIQLLLPLPLIVAMVRGRAPGEGRSLRAAKALLVPGVTVVMVGLALYGWLMPGRLVHF